MEVTDGGYSAGNYRFMGDMNPMWLFATYLANVTGHFLTKLPGGDMLIGLRCYTKLPVLSKKGYMQFSLPSLFLSSYYIRSIGFYLQDRTLQFRGVPAA